MIIYDKRKPKTFDGANCVGITGENLAETQEFLIRGMCDITVDYTIHLRFADGSVNSVIPDSTAIDETGTKLVWKVRKNDIFMHGYFELQLEGRGENGYVFQTQIVTLYADESIPIEDKEYLNPNSETLKLREETQKLLDETKLCRTEIDKTKKLIEQSDITKKEDNSNKVSDSSQIIDYTQNYPSIKYLEAYYLPASKSYGRDELDGMFAAKADRATTLDGYGITDTYTQSQIKTKLEQKLNKMPFDSEPTLNSPCYLTSGAVYNALLAKADKSTTLAGYGISDAYTQEETNKKLARKLDSMPFDSEPKNNSPCYLTSGTVYNSLLTKADKTETDNLLAEKADKVDVDTLLSNKANLVNSSNIFDFDAWAKGLQSLTTPVYRGTLDELNFAEKSITITPTPTSNDTFTMGWYAPFPETMKISVKPNTKYWICWLTNNNNSNAFVFLNGNSTNNVRITRGKGTFVTNNDTSFITIRFGTNNSGTFKVSKIMIAEKESIYLPNEVAEGVPEVADEILAFEKTTQTSLDGKYDSANIESGTSKLTPYSTITDKIKSASCTYKTIGDVVIINATITMNAVTIGANSTYPLINLPYKCISVDDVFCVGISNLGKLFKFAVVKNNTWLQFQSQDKTAYTFADGEQINVICSYKIK